MADLRGRSRVVAFQAVLAASFFTVPTGEPPETSAPRPASRPRVLTIVAPAAKIFLLLGPGEITLLTATFSYLAAASIASALLAVTRRNPVHSMLWVLALFLHVAGIFLMLGAEFLAAVQVIVYAGAILIFYLFVLMLLDLPDEERGPRFGRHWPFAALAGVSFLFLGWLARVEPVQSASTGNRAVPAAGTESAFQGSLSEIGMQLFGPFALPVEIASLVLLAAIIGAVVLARRRAARS